MDGFIFRDLLKMSRKTKGTGQRGGRDKLMNPPGDNGKKKAGEQLETEPIGRIYNSMGWIAGGKCHMHSALNIVIHKR